MRQNLLHPETQLSSRLKRRHWVLAVMTPALLVMFAAPAHAQHCDWLTAPSYYTHDTATGQRVNQFAPDPKVIHTPDPTVSVYRHQRSSLQVDGSIDQYHKVIRAGDPVRPYGEWQHPYRPYSVPYSDWAYGSPFGHLANPPRTNPILPPTFLVPGYGYGLGSGPTAPFAPGIPGPGPGFGPGPGLGTGFGP